MNPKDISIKNYTYHLPDEKIAKFPLEDRAMSKLLVYNDKGEISETIFNQINQYLPSNARLIFNTTKVVCARMLFYTPLDKKIEIFILEPANHLEIQQAMLQKGSGEWICLVGNLKHFKQDFIIKEFEFEGNTYFIKVFKPVTEGDSFKAKIEWSEELSFAEVLSFAGIIPLPPYMKRMPVEGDSSRYQTVYAEQEGSVAAPTAGLHFTPELINKIKSQGVKCSEVVLHVGAGTFKPVKSETMNDHQMHAEEIIVDLNLLEDMIADISPIVVVGTTSMRTMESLFWFGLKLAIEGINSYSKLEVGQWDPYTLEVPNGFDYIKAFQNIVDMLKHTKQKYLKGKTQLLIAPGYEFRIPEAIITNFHQPDSTLLLLVSAFTEGENWRKIYDYALNHDFRFLSFGDSSILYRKKGTI